MRFLGCDLALNHSAFVALDENGERAGFRFYTNEKRIAFVGGPAAAHLPVPNPKEVTDSHAREMLRAAFAYATLRRFLDELGPVDFAYVENYAYGTPKGELTGEIAGPFKLTLWGRGIPFRLVGPESVKMFAAWKGNADKSEVVEAVRRRWGQDFSAFRKPPAPKTGNVPKDAAETEEDLADAYTLARLAWTEWRLRSGRITPQDLEHDQERRVFLRTTKVQPVNILGSDWTALQFVPERWQP